MIYKDDAIYVCAGRISMCVKTALVLSYQIIIYYNKKLLFNNNTIYDFKFIMLTKFLNLILCFKYINLINKKARLRLIIVLKKLILKH